MLWTIAVILLILWLLGFSFHVGGGLIHIILVIVVIVVIVRLVTGRGCRPGAVILTNARLTRRASQSQNVRPTLDCLSEMHRSEIRRGFRRMRALRTCNVQVRIRDQTGA